MNRKIIVELLQNGMRYPVGRHQFWVSRCFEITVHPNRVVEVDEFESYEEKNGVRFRNGTPASVKRRDRMFHIGRSIISMKNRKVVENAPGSGWLDSGCRPAVLDRVR